MSLKFDVPQTFIYLKTNQPWYCKLSPSKFLSRFVTPQMLIHFRIWLPSNITQTFNLGKSPQFSSHTHFYQTTSTFSDKVSLVFPPFYLYSHWWSCISLIDWSFSFNPLSDISDLECCMLNSATSYHHHLPSQYHPWLTNIVLCPQSLWLFLTLHWASTCDLLSPLFHLLYWSVPSYHFLNICPTYILFCALCVPHNSFHPSYTASLSLWHGCTAHMYNITSLWPWLNKVIKFSPLTFSAPLYLSALKFAII